MNQTAEKKRCDGEKKEYVSPCMNVVQLNATAALLADSDCGDEEICADSNGG